MCRVPRSVRRACAREFYRTSAVVIHFIEHAIDHDGCIYNCRPVIAVRLGPTTSERQDLVRAKVAVVGSDDAQDGVGKDVAIPDLNRITRHPLRFDRLATPVTDSVGRTQSVIPGPGWHHGRGPSVGRPVRVAAGRGLSRATVR